jgi:hypothetical protein
MKRLDMFFLIPALLLTIVASAALAQAKAAVDRASAASLHSARLHRRASPHNAELPRYTPFDRLSPRQLKAIGVFEYFTFLQGDCFCRKARVVSTKSSAPSQFIFPQRLPTPSSAASPPLPTPPLPFPT